MWIKKYLLINVENWLFLIANQIFVLAFLTWSLKNIKIGEIDRNSKIIIMWFESHKFKS